MIIADSIYNTVRQYPNKIGIVGGDEDVRLSYTEFYNRINKICLFFKSVECGKGNRVAILHSNSHLFMEIYYAAAISGIILVPLNHRLSDNELAFWCNDSEVTLLISEYSFKDKIENILEQCEKIQSTVWTHFPVSQECDLPPTQKVYEQIIEELPQQPFEEPELSHEDIAQIFYTSGSTGRPKGVIITHMNMVFDALATIIEYRLTDSDVYLHTTPMFHLTDAVLTWAVTWMGSVHVIMSRFDPLNIMKTIEREKVTVAKMVPMMWNQIVHHPQVGEFDFSSLRLVISGGAPASPNLVENIMETFKCEYFQNYGLTEATQFLTVSRLKDFQQCLPYEDKLKCLSATGRPFFGIRVRVVDENGKDVESDGKHVGEIIAKGDIITPGYWNLAEENAKAFKDGWLYTGDLATIDEEQYIRIVDRKKEMIITGGENVYCQEIENLIYQHPDVFETAVIGVPDRKWGEAVKAVVVPKDNCTLTEQELIAFCRDRIAHYKCPKSVDIVDELPKTGPGKIYKKGLREPYWQGHKKRVFGT